MRKGTRSDLDAKRTVAVWLVFGAVLGMGTGVQVFVGTQSWLGLIACGFSGLVIGAAGATFRIVQMRRR